MSKTDQTIGRCVKKESQSANMHNVHREVKYRVALTVINKENAAVVVNPLFPARLLNTPTQREF